MLLAPSNAAVGNGSTDAYFNDSAEAALLLEYANNTDVQLLNDNNLTVTMSVTKQLQVCYFSHFAFCCMGKHTLQSMISLIAYSYVLPAVCIMGLIGNIANLTTLASPRLRQVCPTVSQQVLSTL